MKHIVGHIILAHADLHRVFELTEYLTNHNSPVVIHIDKKTSTTAFQKLCTDLEGNNQVHFVPRTNSEWGTMSLVKATMDCAEAIIKHFPQVGHVFLTSGSCLPTGPISDLQKFLAKNQGTDFVESVSIENETWVQDGLSSERFKFYFPFSWKKQRWLFDKATWIQRKMNITRKRPDNFTPHLGSQWWCMTKHTLTELINDPLRSEYDRYFAKSWIPDESYFQTLVRKHSERLESRSLTWAKFDGQGKPFLLYDDHLDLFSHAGFFMARKVWAKADLVYSEMLGEKTSKRPKPKLTDAESKRFFDDARNAQVMSVSGKLNPGRFPTGKHAKLDKTARPYTVLIGAREMYPDLQEWLNLNENILCHGNLFEQNEVEFADGATVFAGNVSANRLIRNYRAPAFLANVIWNKREIPQTFFFDLGDNQKAHDAIFKDPNAHVIMVDEAWILHFLSLQKVGADTRSKAKLLHAGEQRLNRVISRLSTKAKISRYSIKDLLLYPNQYLKEVQETASQQVVPLSSTPIQNIDFDMLNMVIQHLRNEGFKLNTGLISTSEISGAKTGIKPRLIKA